MVETEELSLDTVGRGAAPELFEHELQRVLENILDPNTDPEAKRKITLEVTIKPGEDRSQAATSVQVKSKLAPPKPVESPIYLGEKEGRLIAVGFDPNQRQLFGDSEEEEKVTPITSKEAQHAGS